MFATTVGRYAFGNCFCPSLAIFNAMSFFWTENPIGSVVPYCCWQNDCKFQISQITARDVVKRSLCLHRHLLTASPSPTKQIVQLLVAFLVSWFLKIWNYTVRLILKISTWNWWRNNIQEYPTNFEIFNYGWIRYFNWNNKQSPLPPV